MAQHNAHFNPAHPECYSHHNYGNNLTTANYLILIYLVGKDKNNFIRATFFVRGMRPILMKINKAQDNLNAIKTKIARKLSLPNPEKFSFYLENGARIDDIYLIEHNDNILMDYYAVNNKNQVTSSERDYECLPNTYMQPLEHTTPFGYQNGKRIYTGYHFHPIPPLFIPKYLKTNQVNPKEKSVNIKEKIEQILEEDSANMRTNDGSMVNPSPKIDYNLFSSRKSADFEFSEKDPEKFKFENPTKNSSIVDEKSSLNPIPDLNFNYN